MSLLWKLGGIALACVAAYFLVTMYGAARYKEGKSDERSAWQDSRVKAEQEKMAAFQRGLEQRQAAETRYIETVRQLPGTTQTIIERSTEYAQTPDGAIQCLPADRVLWLEQTRTGLFPPAASAASNLAGPLRPDAPGL